MPIGPVEAGNGEATPHGIGLNGLTFWNLSLDELVDRMIRVLHHIVVVDHAIFQHDYAGVPGPESLLEDLLFVEVNDAESDVGLILIKIIVQNMRRPSAQRVHVVIFPGNGLTECDDPSSIAG